MTWPNDFINKIICGDCLEVMKEMPSESVDLIIADPPFNVGLCYGRDFNDKRDPSIYWAWLYDRLEQVFRISKEGARCYVFHTDEGIFRLRGLCESIGYKYHQLLIWYGPNTPCTTRIVKDWSCLHEFIVLFIKGKRTPMLQASVKTTTHAVQIHTRPQSNFKGGRDHPAQKPKGLMAALIARTPGQIILFPFGGSGVGARAAKDLKRDFISIDINPDYCAIKEDRLAQGVL